MTKANLEYVVSNLRCQVTGLEGEIMDLYKRLKAMAACLNLVYVPPETSKLKYEKKQEE